MMVLGLLDKNITMHKQKVMFKLTIQRTNL